MATFKINNGDSITFAFTLTGVEATDILNLEFAIGNNSYTLANGKLIQSNNDPLLFYIYMLSKDTFCLNGNYPISVAINTEALGVLKKNLVGNLAVVKTNTKMNLPVPTQTITATYNFTVDTNGIIVDEFLAQIAKGEPGDSAYQIAVDNGFVGTETQWLASLKGEQGIQGEQGEQGLTGFAWNINRVSPNGYLIGEIVNYLGNYYICIANNDAIIPTDSLGVYWNTYTFKGEDGLSAYEVAVDNGFVGTESEWLASLQAFKTSDLINDGADGLHPFITLEDIPSIVGGNLGLIRIEDIYSGGELFTDLATASAYIRNYTNAVITDESFDTGVFYFTVPRNSSFDLTDGFCTGTNANFYDELGLISTFGNYAFNACSGNIILGDVAFGADCISGQSNIEIGNIYGFGANFCNNFTGKLIIKKGLPYSTDTSFLFASTGTLEVPLLIKDYPLIPIARANGANISLDGFDKEIQSNKQNSLANDGTGIKYPTVDAVNTGLVNVNIDAVDKVSVKLDEAIAKGQAVYVSGANGTNILVKKASNITEATSSKTLGLLAIGGILNDLVNVVTDGLLDGLNTSTATIGDAVWLGVNGDLIYGLVNKPYAPAHLVYIGVVTRVSATVGEIFVHVQNGFELNEIHDVDLKSTTPITGNILAYNGTLWTNQTISSILGYTPANANLLGSLIVEEILFTGSQILTLLNNYSQIYSVSVSGGGALLKDLEYTLIAPNQIDFGGRLEVNDYIIVQYSTLPVGLQPYYSQAQIDILVSKINLETVLGKASNTNNGYLSSADWNDFNNKLRGNETFRGVNYSNNSTTEVVSGGVVMSTTGSVIARSVTSTNYATKQIRKGFYGSVVSVGRYTGTRGTALLWFMGGGFKFICDFYISDTAFGSGCRQFYGMMGQTTDLTYSDTILVGTMINVIGVGSDALDTNLQIFHNDSTGVCTKIDLGVNFPANRTAGAGLTTIYSIELFNNPNTSSVLYRVVNKENGSIATGVISSNLPLNTQGLNFTASRCMGAGITNTGQFDLSILGVYSL